MGDFREHVMFGFLTAAIVSYFLKDIVQLTNLEVAASAVMLVVGSVLPDIDHKNAYVHRAVKAFTSIGAGILTIIYSPFPMHLSLAAAAMMFLSVYTGFSSIKMKHRGFTHSISFLMITSLLGAVLSVYTLASLTPGFALGVGLLSHLLLDQHVSLR